MRESPWDDWEEAGAGEGWRFTDTGNIVICCKECGWLCELGPTMQWLPPLPETLAMVRNRHNC